MSIEIENPYKGQWSWLKGNVHVHTNEDVGADANIDREHGGKRGEVIEKSISYPFFFDFICTSVHPYIGSIEKFSKGEEKDDIVVISGREIQNDTVNNGDYKGGYFHGEAAKYLHVLTIGGEGGVSICCHPCFFEKTRPKVGGEWENIRTALLDPCENLKALNVIGIEVYNGLSVLEEHLGEVEYCPEFSEPCWDDLLCKGYRCLGFAGNDEFYRDNYVYENFCPLGFLMVRSSKTENDIIENIRNGKFYASTGVMLAEEPLRIEKNNEEVVFHLSAAEEVRWTAFVYEELGHHFELTRIDASSVGEQWSFVQRKSWKYIRFQAESPSDMKKRAWLQPIYGPGWSDS